MKYLGENKDQQIKDTDTKQEYDCVKQKVQQEGKDEEQNQFEKNYLQLQQFDKIQPNNKQISDLNFDISNQKIEVHKTIDFNPPMEIQTTDNDQQNKQIIGQQNLLRIQNNYDQITNSIKQDQHEQQDKEITFNKNMQDLKLISKSINEQNNNFLQIHISAQIEKNRSQQLQQLSNNQTIQISQSDFKNSFMSNTYENHNTPKNALLKQFESIKIQLSDLEYQMIHELKPIIQTQNDQETQLNLQKQDKIKKQSLFEIQNQINQIFTQKRSQDGSSKIKSLINEVNQAQRVSNEKQNYEQKYVSSSQNVRLNCVKRQDDLDLTQQIQKILFHDQNLLKLLFSQYPTIDLLKTQENRKQVKKIMSLVKGNQHQVNLFDDQDQQLKFLEYKKSSIQQRNLISQKPQTNRSEQNLQIQSQIYQNSNENNKLRLKIINESGSQSFDDDEHYLEGLKQDLQDKTQKIIRISSEHFNNNLFEEQSINNIQQSCELSDSLAKILNSKDLTNSNVKNFLNLDLNSQQNNDEIKLLNQNPLSCKNILDSPSQYQQYTNQKLQLNFRPSLKEITEVSYIETNNSQGLIGNNNQFKVHQQSLQNIFQSINSDNQKIRQTLNDNNGINLIQINVKIFNQRRNFNQ